MHKKIVFFDGDGTLWYPTATKRAEKPWWIYYDEATKDNYLDHLSLTPSTVSTLTAMRERGIRTALLSTHPHEAQEASRVLQGKIEHFNLTELFDEVHATAEHSDAKGVKILEVLRMQGLEKEDALMVGDSYRWDYLSAVDSGVEAVLVDSDHHQNHLGDEPATACIQELYELLALIE
jgi:phosphoglycolate phosphatase-like HAD superfamily hydrolase